MPQIKTLILNDGTTLNNYVPLGINVNGVASFRDISGGVSSVAPSATLSGRSNKADHKVIFTHECPLSTLDEGGRTVPTGQKLWSRTEYRIPDGATAAEIAAFLSEGIDLAGDVDVNSLIVDREAMW